MTAIPFFDFTNNVYLCNRSHWGLLTLSGDDRIRFLHNQTTNNIQALKPGEGCDTVFVTSTGRNIDLVSAYVRQEDILLLVSPGENQRLYQWMDCYIFPFDKVQLRDISSQFSIFTLIGKQSTHLLANNLLANCFESSVLSAPEFQHFSVKIDGIEVFVTVGCNLKLPGYNLIVSREKADFLWEKLANLPLEIIDEEAWERLRILRGRPAVYHELTEDYNPLEAGLWHAVSFNKGCYIGQETIARLNTYRGVKQRLWGIKLTGKINPDTDIHITVGEEKVGKLTSYFHTEELSFALGYIRTKAGGEGLQVIVGSEKGEVVALPFIRHEYYLGDKM